MKQVMMVKFDSPKWRKVDEYKVANPFVDVGFRQVKDVVDLRVFDLLNISRINNNRAEEMLLCIYHLLQPDRRIDEGIYNDEIDQYFSYREWKKKHQPLSGVTVREILATEDLNEDALLRIFDGVTAAFYKSDEYNSREYAEIQQQISELKKQFPCIMNVMEEKGEIHLTAEEHAAFVQCLRLQRKLDDMERLQLYFRGHTDAVAYLKKIKAI